jgi:hypothetical protein
MWGFVAVAALYVGEWAYHRWWADKPEVKPEDRRFHIPRVDNGAPVPLIYGRCRVRAPILGYVNTPAFAADGIAIGSSYQLKMMFTLGIPFENGTNVVHGMWIGDQKMRWGLITGPLGSTQTGDGNFEDAIGVESGDLGGWEYHGTVETLNGKPTQSLIDDDGTATTALGAELHTTLLADFIPGYRGVMTAFLKGDSAAPAGFALGPNTDIPTFSFECSSYKDTGGITYTGKIGDDANPIAVLYDLVSSYLGKLGVDAATYIDSASWQTAAYKLKLEGNGFSFAFEEAQTLGDRIAMIIEQIDAALYEDPATGKLKIKLVRADYSPGSLRQIDKTNCVDIVNLSIGGHQGLVNRVRLVYSSREHDYNDRDVFAENMANAAGQSGAVVESVLQMPAVTNALQAYKIAQRELAWRCRPMMKCRAIVDRTFYDTNPGDVYRLVWSKPDIAGLVFRVARVDRGSLDDGKIALDLMLDNSYVWRTFSAQDPFPHTKGDTLFGR